MQRSNLFYSYYDVLFSAKNYTEEVDRIMSILEDNGIVADHILEIGCGTGNHTIALAEKALHVHAIDTDAGMVKHALHKTGHLDHVTVEHTKVEDLDLPEFDACIAMFNVITYITAIPDLISFFSGVSRSLKPGGVFVFDCWNGVAAIKSPPVSKFTTHYYQQQKITCELSSDPDLFKQQVRLTYKIDVYENESDLTGSGAFSFDQFLWTYNEISYCLRLSGFDLLKCTQNVPPYHPATDADWKMMFICKKKSL